MIIRNVSKVMIYKYNQNIDFLRILLMSMIVLWHFYVHSGINVLSMDVFQHDSVWKGIPFILPLLCYHVDSFMVISGSFGIRFKMKKILLFYLQTFFYAVLVFILQYINDELPTPKVVIAFLLMPYRMWWYAEIYFYMMLIGPLISMGLCALSKKSQITILSIAFVFVVLFPFLSGISNFRMTMIFIYALACYIHHNQLVFLNKYSGMTFFLCISVLLFVRFLAVYFHNESLYDKSCAYSNPFTILAALSFFSFFSNMRTNIQFPFMKYIVPGLFATYLLTDSRSTRIINCYVIEHFGTNPILLLFIALIFCVVIGFLDTLRGMLFDKVLRKCGIS